MRFNSYLFLFSLIAVLAVLWLLPARARRGWLLFTSYAFYASWGVNFLAVLVGTGTLNYFGAKWIASASNRKRRGAFVIAANVCLLATFKYLGWLCGNMNLLADHLGASFRLPVPHWAFPLGISFYVFESISYIVDVTRGREKPRRFIDLQLFIAFFPKLMAGPILRGREFFYQLDLIRRPDAAAIRYGVRQIVFGLFLKTVMVDRAYFGLADNVNEAFSHPYQQATAADVWIMCFAFSLQLYFDYSAYTRIALGAAKLCGITLVENFDHPFMSRSPAEFWQRWNMSLSRWIRDYLFLPLQGGLEGASKLRTAWAAFASMVVFGVWHGAGWNFVAWGVYNGLVLTGYYMIVPPANANRGATGANVWVRKIGGHIITIALFCLGALFFRCPEVSMALGLARHAIDPWNYPGLGLRPVFAAATLELVGFVLIAGILDALGRPGKEQMRAQGLRYAFAMLEGTGMGVLFVVTVVHLQNQRAFVYFQF
jgi:alginate O-acetyltransferase complex protein AlgI